MMKCNVQFLLSIFWLVAISCAPAPEAVTPEAAPAVPLNPPHLAQLNADLGPGLNMGNALEAPFEGEWDVIIKDEYFTIMKEAGFKSVRIPIRWSAHADTMAPYAIDSVFMARVKYVVDLALETDLKVIINTHHYNPLFQDPQAHQPRLLAFWHQIGLAFKDYPMDLIFEPLNEPHEKLTPELWNEWIPVLTKEVRSTNPERTLMFGTANWGGISKLNDLVIPVEERNVIVTVHYYEPFHFTHQGASWVDGSKEWLGKTWVAGGDQSAEINEHFDLIKAYAKKYNRPIYIGEFGAFSAADSTSRAAYTAAVVQASEARGFSWSYWEFCSGFGAYDPKAEVWREDLLNALIPQD